MKTAIPSRENQRNARMARYVKSMLELCIYAQRNRDKSVFPCRDFLRKLHMETAGIQELVDRYGAQKNQTWFPFRETIAAGKTFSSVYYNLLHVYSVLSSYTLIEIEGDFIGDCEAVLQKLKTAVIICCTELEKQSKRCGIYPEGITGSVKPCEEEGLPSRFPEKREERHVEKVGEAVVYLATQFLNLTEGRDVKELLRERQRKNFPSCIPDVVNEERCRLVESNFHNLQSMYDTYLFETDLESQNRELLYLRGHISIIYHLLQIATDLIHYFIRHMSQLRRETYAEIRFPLGKDEILGIIFSYFLRYARLYMEAARHLCRSMIRRYSVATDITVPIPNYRGFHVRPSTLIARIVAHYGSNVTMHLGGEEYDAGKTLDLFRANEEINAQKRRFVSEVISKRPELKIPAVSDEQERKRRLQLLLLDMMNNREIILYDTNLQFDSLTPHEQETLAGLASRYIKYFMSIAQIDVRSDITVTFHGDSRALKDIKQLAEHGYGEDRFGNNIVLPADLAYLRS